LQWLLLLLLLLLCGVLVVAKAWYVCVTWGDCDPACCCCCGLGVCRGEGQAGGQAWVLLLLLPLLLLVMWGRGREHCTGPAADDTAGIPLLLWVLLLLLQQL
jgi:hypothetical protein